MLNSKKKKAYYIAFEVINSAGETVYKGFTQDSYTGHINIAALLEQKVQRLRFDSGHTGLAQLVVIQDL